MYPHQSDKRNLIISKFIINRYVGYIAQQKNIQDARNKNTHPTVMTL